MTLKPTEPEIRTLVAEAAQRATSSLALEDDFGEDLGLDSLDRLELLAVVEDRFDLQLSGRQITGIRSLGDLLVAVDAAPRERSP